MSRRSRREKLLASARRLARRINAAKAELSQQKDSLEIGEVYLSRRPKDLAVGWLVIGSRPEVIPVDDFPLIGSRDVMLPWQVLGSFAVARCGLGVALDSDAGLGRRIGVLPRQVLNLVLQTSKAIEQGTLSQSRAQEAIDSDPEYRSWTELVLRNLRERITSRANNDGGKGGSESSDSDSQREAIARSEMSEQIADRAPPTHTKSTEPRHIFTEFLHRTSGSIGLAGPKEYQEIREMFRVLLVRELRRRGLFHAPPSSLGFCGADWQGGPMEDLISDAYMFILIDHYRSLLQAVQDQNHIDPLVHRYVRLFVGKMQRKADPLGCRIYCRLVQAVKRAIKRGEAWVNIEGHLSCQTIVYLSATRPSDPPCSRGRLAELIFQWNHDRMPCLVTSQNETALKAIGKKLYSLPGEAVWAFRFGDLVREMTADARRRWRAAREYSCQATSQVAGREQGGDTLQDKAIERSRAKVAPRLPRHLMKVAAIHCERDPNQRNELRKLWQEVQMRVKGSSESSAPPRKFAQMERIMAFHRRKSLESRLDSKEFKDRAVG